jgi:hypothetical protein
MTSEDVGFAAPNADQGPLSVSRSQMVKKCLEIVREYRKGDGTPLTKAATIGKITDALTSLSPQLTERETNDSLGSYLRIIDQHNRTQDTAGENGAGRSQTVDESRIGAKRAGSPDRTEPSERQKNDDKDFPWVVQEDLGVNLILSDDLQNTLELLRTYARDLKFTKLSILTSPFAPQFLSSEWSNVITGSMVDLDHVLSGGFAVASDNRDVETVGRIQFKFGAARPIKHVKNAGDWFIAWGMYLKAITFAFPHRISELASYSQHILGLFSTTAVEHQTNIIMLDKAI